MRSCLSFAKYYQAQGERGFDAFSNVIAVSAKTPRQTSIRGPDVGARPYFLHDPLTLSYNVIYTASYRAMQRLQYLDTHSAAGIYSVFSAPELDQSS